MRLLFFIISLTIGSFAFGQKAIVRGKITSEISGKAPLEEISVMVKGKVIGGLTDSVGHYQITDLELNKNYTLLVLAFGYPQISKDITTNDTVTVVDFVLDTECKFTKEQAEKDIRARKIKLLLIGSIAPIANSVADNSFQKKYKVDYLDFGCSPPAMECIKAYNETIFEYLDKLYGKEWRKEVRQDVEFLK